MSGNTFLEQKFSEICQNKNWEAPLSWCMGGCFVLASFKAFNLKLYQTNTLGLCDYTIVATAINPTSAQNAVSTLSRICKKEKIKIISLEGIDTAQWILLDLGDFIVHVFSENFREVYDLDSIYKRQTVIEIPEEIYFEGNKAETFVKDTFNDLDSSERSYF